MKLKPPEHLIYDHIEANSSLLLFAQWGFGKSFLAIDWGMCIASNTPFYGHDIKKQGAVIFIIGEGFPEEGIPWGILGANGTENPETLQVLNRRG